MGKFSESPQSPPQSRSTFFGWVVMFFCCLGSYEYGYFHGKYVIMSKLYYGNGTPGTFEERLESLKKVPPLRNKVFWFEEPGRVP